MGTIHGGGTGPYLQIKHVGKSFGNFRALEDISFDIHDGEFVCFLGPSGCGKTTLLRCIAGLEYQSEGSIHQGGVDISWLPPSKRDFGIVFQSYALFPNLNVADNVAYGLVNKQLEKSHIKERVTDLLSLVDLARHADKYPSQLSGGRWSGRWPLRPGYCCSMSRSRPWMPRSGLIFDARFGICRSASG
jgi:iron(III) transport system ATP-binding protein